MSTEGTSSHSQVTINLDVGKIFSEAAIMIGILLGLLIIWISSFVASVGGGYRAVGILQIIGALPVGVFLLCGGLFNKNIDRFVRIAMVMSSAILIPKLMVF